MENNSQYNEVGFYSVDIYQAQEERNGMTSGMLV